MSRRASIDHIEAAVLAAGGTFHQRGANLFRSIGVCHGGQRSESLVFMYDPEHGRVNLHCHAGCDFEHILDALGIVSADRYDEPRDHDTGQPWEPKPPRSQPPKPAPVLYDPAPRGWRPTPSQWMNCERGHSKVAEYLYADAESRVRFGVCRCDHKCFRQWRPDPAARSGRAWSIREYQHGDLVATVPALPYRLPQVLAGIADERVVWIAEGEKDVLALVGIGMVATCNAEGAGKWTDEHAAHLRNADTVVVADRDVAGRKHAEKVVATLMPVARSIEVVVAREGKDAADHIAAGLGSWQFDTIWEPKPFDPDEVAL